jgi:hypothetical protein
MENTMTTKKAIVVIGSVVFLMVLLFVVPADSVGLKRPNQKKLILKSSEELAVLQGDADKNGTPDWRDMLINNMSPTLKEEASKAVVTNSSKKNLEDPNNLTSSFAKNIYTSSVYVSQKGNLTQAQQEELGAKIAQEASSKLVFTTYSLNDLHIIKDDSQNAIKKYGNELGTIYTKTSSGNITRDDIAIIEAYNVNKDASVLEAFVVKKNVLETAITSLLALPVPTPVASYHLRLINKLSDYKIIIDNLSQLDTDPVRALIAFDSYLPVIKSLSSSFSGMQGYMKSEGITFSSSESGYILLEGYTQ